MKRLLIILGLIGVVHVTIGLNPSTTLLNPKKEISDSRSTGILSPLTPTFTELDGNLFLAIQSDDNIKVADGDVVEFVFGRNSKLISFHINDINQDLIDKGEAQLFVMIHQDLALKLRSNRLRDINVINNGKKYAIPVDNYWVPDSYLTSL